MIQVFIIDDHKMFIDGVSLLLKNNAKIVLQGYATSAKEGIKQLEKKKIDILLLDISMPEINGIEACKIITADFPNIKIIIITMHKESSLIKLLLKEGAKGYILKNAGQKTLVEAVKKVYEGQMYLGESVNNIVINSMINQKTKQSKNPFPTLTRREKEILNLILDEYTTQEIADKLFISFGTVETHRRNMMIKIGARNTAGLVRIALEFALHK